MASLRLYKQPNPTPSLRSAFKRTRVASAGKQLRNRMQNHTCLQRRAGVRARGGNRLANQVLNRVILRVPTPLCLAERLAEIYSLFKIFGYVFEIDGAPTRQN